MQRLGSSVAAVAKCAAVSDPAIQTAALVRCIAAVQCVEDSSQTEKPECHLASEHCQPLCSCTRSVLLFHDPTREDNIRCATPDCGGVTNSRKWRLKVCRYNCKQRGRLRKLSETAPFGCEDFRLRKGEVVGRGDAMFTKSFKIERTLLKTKSQQKLVLTLITKRSIFEKNVSSETQLQA